MTETSEHHRNAAIGAPAIRIATEGSLHFVPANLKTKMAPDNRKGWRSCVPPPLRFNDFAPVIQHYLLHRTQGDAEMIPGVPQFAVAKQCALGDQIR